MSFTASAFQTLRSCTAAVSSRTAARPALARASLSRSGVRWYSEQTSANSEEPTKEEATPNHQAKQIEELQKKLKAKEEEAVDLTGRLRYLQADFLNLQRNSAREKEQTRDFAITRFATDLLETVDVLSLALKSVPTEALKAPAEASDADANAPPLPKGHDTYLRELHEGVDMTQRQLLSTLFKYHVKPFDPIGDKFDPHLHEALYQAPVPGKEPGTVIDCQTIGYKIKDRVLRAARVGVAQETS